MSSDTRTEIEVEGAADGEYDTIEVLGTATLDGSMDVTVADGFAAPDGWSPAFVAARAIEGSFTSRSAAYASGAALEGQLNDVMTSNSVIVEDATLGSIEEVVTVSEEVAAGEDTATPGSGAGSGSGSGSGSGGNGGNGGGNGDGNGGGDDGTMMIVGIVIAVAVVGGGVGLVLVMRQRDASSSKNKKAAPTGSSTGAPGAGTGVWMSNPLQDDKGEAARPTHTRRQADV
jgi:hypothetical protein